MDNKKLFSSSKNTRYLIKNSPKYIRSDFPSIITEEETNNLIKNNIRTIVDLRTREEKNIKNFPLRNDKRFQYYNIPITGGNTIPKNPSQVTASYINMVDKNMKNAINIIMNSKFNVLYFCAAGKDRTGVVSAIILTKLGYNMNEIVDDYLLSAINLKKDLEKYAKINKNIDINVITPKKEYIEGFLGWYAKNKINI